MDNGVLLLCLGNPYYGNYAVQLARSIIAVDPTMKVSVACSGSVLSHNTVLPFDQIIDVPKEYFYTDGLPDYIMRGNKVHAVDGILCP